MWLRLRGARSTALRCARILAERLPDYMVPSAFVVLEALPLTPNGKLDRRALPAPRYDANLAGTYVAPRDALEEIVAGVWRDVLKLEQVGVHDNFFELGGNSLSAIHVISEINRRLKSQRQRPGALRESDRRTNEKTDHKSAAI